MSEQQNDVTEAAPMAEQQAETQEQFAARVPLIAGNWKMNLDHLQAIALVQKLAWSLKDVKHDFSGVEVAVFPPFTDLRSVQTLLAADKLSLALGAQDVSPHLSGAYRRRLGPVSRETRHPLCARRSLGASPRAR